MGKSLMAYIYTEDNMTNLKINIARDIKEIIWF